MSFKQYNTRTMFSTLLFKEPLNTTLAQFDDFYVHMNK